MLRSAAARQALQETPPTMNYSELTRAGSGRSRESVYAVSRALSPAIFACSRSSLCDAIALYEKGGTKLQPPDEAGCVLCSKDKKKFRPPKNNLGYPC